MTRALWLTWAVLPVALAACVPGTKKVQDAEQATRSWAVTVKAVTEQWVQSRVSQRFTRTTLNTAIADLNRQAESIRQVDPEVAAEIVRLKNAIDPVLAAVAKNEPDQARDLAARLAHDSAGSTRAAHAVAGKPR